MGDKCGVLRQTKEKKLPWFGISANHLRDCSYHSCFSMLPPHFFMPKETLMPTKPNTTLMIVILLFALLAVFYLDTLKEGTQLFTLIGREEGRKLCFSPLY